jgi:DNA-binding winged helix-turn-helix (wHTH) protein
MESPQIEGPVPRPRVFRFGIFELDTQSRELRRHGLKIRLPDQSFQILHMLLSHPGEVVTRDDLRRQLWTSETFVDFDVGLNSAIRKLREALEDSADNPRFVETLPRRGYRFIAPLTPAIDEPTKEPGAYHVHLASFRLGRHWIAGGVALALIVAAAALWYERRGSARLLAGMAPGQIRSLAVLPFENLTGDPGQDYFVDGVTPFTTGPRESGWLQASQNTPSRCNTGIPQVIPVARSWMSMPCWKEPLSGPATMRIHRSADSRENRRHLWAELRGRVGGHGCPRSVNFARVSPNRQPVELSSPINACAAVDQIRRLDAYLGASPSRTGNRRGFRPRLLFRTGFQQPDFAGACGPWLGRASASCRPHAA